ncbi:thiaminase II [Radiobacillus deserti]|uniref:Aminopyrimidine aminohydrolase n=1 Tax=Radiobacillus deserti TaxID=2594883 RepID=A0A516KI29_9BACI|nr:thiaminase II [Radiobacillus deserti]QDP41050.1 thiaminase II [Radiobacillus deserti]
MLFSEKLRKEADEIYQGIFRHPFVEGLGKGDLDPESIIHYVKADFEYLNAFMNIYGLAIAKSTRREDMAYFHEQIAFVLNGEIHPHNNLCRVAGVAYDDLKGFPLPPTADHYVSHMKSTALTGSMGEILAALLPCPWTYYEIGKYLMETVQPKPDHPFYEWITFYAEDEVGQITNELRRRLDTWAKGVGPDELEKAKVAFLKSCQLEYRFWDMAITKEIWPFSVEQEVTTS